MENEDLQERPAAAVDPPAADLDADRAEDGDEAVVVPEATGDPAVTGENDQPAEAASIAAEAAVEAFGDAQAEEALAEALDDAADGSLAEAVVADAAAEAAVDDAADDLAAAEALHETASDEAEAGDLEGAAANEALAGELEAAAADTVAEAVVDEAIVEEALSDAIEDRAAADVLHEDAAETAAEALVEEAVSEAIAEEPTPDATSTEGAAPDEAAPETADDSAIRGPGDWYVVHTYSGYENKVKANLHQRIASMQMEDKIFDVVIPMEDVMEIKGGKKQVVQRKVFPGYLLVRMIYDNDSWYVVRNTPGVTGFVSSGTGTKPTPLSRREVEKILSVPKADERKKPEYRLEWEEGDVVRIIAGPFADFTGTISEINVEQSKLRVMVNIFDRETPVELAFDQVAKA
jgi:transcriptional antiterminator NusG